MSKLYTSLVHAKLELNGGELRPMTPVPEKHHDIIDPALTIGLGALREETGRGLQCPVRGCGKWFDSLKVHLDRTHADVGGSQNIKRILSIPVTAKLVSTESRERSARGRSKGNASFARQHITPASYRKAKRTLAKNSRTTGMRNLRNACEQQVAHRLLDLQSRIGRSPSSTEARLLDSTLVDACIAIYGTWNSAKLVVGMELIKAGNGPMYDRDDILSLFRVYYQLTGILPSLRQMEKLKLVWLLPSPPTIRKHFPGKSWPEIMDWVAWKLGVADGRYGKPEYAKVLDLTAASLVKEGVS